MVRQSAYGFIWTLVLIWNSIIPPVSRMAGIWKEAILHEKFESVWLMRWYSTWFEHSSKICNTHTFFKIFQLWFEHNTVKTSKICKTHTFFTIFQVCSNLVKQHFINLTNSNFSWFFAISNTPGAGWIVEWKEFWCKVSVCEYDSAFG